MAQSAIARPPSPGGAERHPKVLQFVEHWRSLAPAPGLLPGRQHFDPMRVPSLLPNIWLVDVLPGTPRQFRYRLLGTRLVEAGIPGRRGELIDDPRHTADPAGVRRLFETIVAGREPNWFRGKPMLRHVTYVETIERVSVPFAADGATVDLIMSLTLFHWDDGSIR